MKKQKRWIKSIIETAQSETTAMPWQRGARRALTVTRRSNGLLKVKSA